MSITSPTSGDNLTGPNTVTVAATDAVGVSSVTLSVDGTVLGTDTTAPYTFAWTAPTGGAHTLTATATDAAGNVGTAPSVPVTVTLPDTTAPTVSISSPAAGASLSGSSPVTVTAADNVGVTSVTLSVDGTTVGTDTTAPYTFTLPAQSVGSHTLTATASDAAGNTTTSAPVTVTAPDTTAPTVAIASPNDGTNAYGPTTVTVNATDDVGVSSVTLSVDGTTVGTSTTAPYTFTWSALTNGAHTLKATASDDAGNVGTSTPITVTVAPDTTAPTAPSGFAAGTVTTSSIALSWNAATDDRGVTGYKVLRDGVVIGTGTTLSATDSGLKPATTYTYTVRAVDAAGNVSADSNALTVTTPAGLYSDSFTGTDGAAWASAWKLTSANGTESIVGNAGQLQFTDVTGAYAQAMLNGLAPLADSNTLLSYQWNSTSATSFFSVYVRGSGGWQNGYRPKTGYGIQLQSNSSIVQVQKNVAGTNTVLQSVSGGQTVTTAKQWLRVQVVGTTIEFRTWTDGQPEPTTWKTVVTDASVATTGQLFLSLNRGSTNVGTKSVTIDDLTVNNAS